MKLVLKKKTFFLIEIIRSLLLLVSLFAVKLDITKELAVLVYMSINLWSYYEYSLKWDLKLENLFSSKAECLKNDFKNYNKCLMTHYDLLLSKKPKPGGWSVTLNPFWNKLECK